jgi:hypothetical protein
LKRNGGLIPKQLGGRAGDILLSRNHREAAQKINIQIAWHGHGGVPLIIKYFDSKVHHYQFSIGFLPR